MSTLYGISTTYADLVLGTLLNQPLTTSILCAQLHTGDPGPNGTSNVSAVTARQQFTLAAPGTGSTSLTGGQPTWSMVTNETIMAISLWSGFDGDDSAIYLFSLPLLLGQTVADGDVFTLTGCSIAFPVAA